MNARADCEVAVVGAGIAGLSAAWALRDRDVVVLEASERIGGRIRSEPRGDLWLNAGAHVFAGADSASGRLLAEAGVPVAPVAGRLAAVALNGRIVSRGPVETFPLRLRTTMASRLALVRVGLRLRLAVRRYASIAAPRPGEDAAERQLRMLRFMDDRSFAQFTGRLPEDADLLLRATVSRSSGEPEEVAAGYGIGYFHLVWSRSGGLARGILGGPGIAVEALAAPLGERLRRGARVISVRREHGRIRIRYLHEGTEHELLAQHAVLATPAYETRAVAGDLPPATADALAAISYGPYVVGALLTGESGPMPWDGIYALATPRRSFSMLFNIANVLRARGHPRQPGGTLMVYAAAGLARALSGLDDTEVAERFTADLRELYPQTEGIVGEVMIQRWERGLPYPRVGRSSLQGALTRPLGALHLAGDYLGTWYTETAVQTALAAAAAIRAQLPAVR